MIPEKWQSLIGNIKDNFKIEEEGKFRIEEEGGVDIEFIVFAGPLGRMRLEFVSKPVILDKKTSYSKRIGSETQVDYVYSETEKTHVLIVYKWEDDKNDWIEIEADSFAK